MRSVPLTGANQQISAAPNPVIYYRGITVRETTAAATALIRIWDGTSATGTILEEVSLAPNESTREDYGDPCPMAKIGVFVQVVSGTVAGSVRLD